MFTAISLAEYVLKIDVNNPEVAVYSSLLNGLHSVVRIRLNLIALISLVQAKANILSFARNRKWALCMRWTHDRENVYSQFVYTTFADPFVINRG